MEEPLKSPPTSGSHTSLCSLGEPRPNLMVSELIDENHRQWNREKLFDLFAYRTRMEIMAIPLARGAGRDKLIWKENK